MNVTRGNKPLHSWERGSVPRGRLSRFGNERAVHLGSLYAVSKAYILHNTLKHLGALNFICGSQFVMFVGLDGGAANGRAMVFEGKGRCCLEPEVL
jgi:hypothetical protein